MSYVKIWIHSVWTVKNRKPVLNRTIRQELFKHILENAIEKGILIEAVNGHNNHVHCFFRQKNNQSLEKVMQLIKGESSFWFNKNHLSNIKLTWQKEYFAVSIGESQVNVVKRYILNQEEHYKKKTWDDEYNEFILKYGFNILIPFKMLICPLNYLV